MSVQVVRIRATYRISKQDPVKSRIEYSKSCGCVRSISPEESQVRYCDEHQEVIEQLSVSERKLYDASDVMMAKYQTRQDRKE